jgi:hypothetical protein
MTNSPSGTTPSHPRPLDYNRAILWARHLVECADWLLVAMKSTPAPVRGDESAMLVSIAVVDHTGKVLLETFIKPSGAINLDAIAKHGIDAGRAFEALRYDELKVLLSEFFATKQALSWNLDDQNCVLESYAAEEKTTPFILQGQSAVNQYSRFVGEWSSAGYKRQELPDVAYNSALSECHAVLDAIKKMASSHQHSDSISTGSEGWTTEFFKPKITPVDKIRGFFK